MKTVLELEDLAAKAIKSALAQEWQAAETLNLEILEDDEQNVEATNRLARAYAELGQIDQAKKTYEKVLLLDPYNSIAQKNMAKLEQGGGPQLTRAISQEAFLEEPGKTRSAPLVEPQKKRLEQLVSGEKLQLEARNGRLAVVTMHGGLLGYIEDDLSSHLLNLMHLGNVYSAHLMTNSGTAQIFLREVTQSESAAKFVSFSRAHAASPTPTSVKSGLSEDAFGSTGDEDADAWEGDGLSDEANEGDTAEDDFTSMSLESMREEEDEENGGYDRSGGRDSY